MKVHMFLGSGNPPLYRYMACGKGTPISVTTTIYHKVTCKKCLAIIKKQEATNE
jgi:hypothetical protein